MSDLVNKMKFLAEAVRGRTQANPDNSKLKPIEQRRRGYQLYAKEAQVMGETPVPYDEWIKSQE